MSASMGALLRGASHYGPSERMDGTDGRAGWAGRDGRPTRVYKLRSEITFPRTRPMSLTSLTILNDDELKAEHRM